MKLKLIVFLLISSIYSVNAQEQSFSKSSIKIASGIGFNETKNETGFGMIYELGYQINLDKKNRLRLNSLISIGQFSASDITDVKDQYYTQTGLQINLNYDLLKFKSTSLLLSGGAYLNNSKGLIGTGGELQTNNQSYYFNNTYVGLIAGMGIRVNSLKSRVAFEIKPLNVQVGNNEFVSIFAAFGIDIKL